MLVSREPAFKRNDVEAGPPRGPAVARRGSPHDPVLLLAAWGVAARPGLAPCRIRVAARPGLAPCRIRVAADPGLPCRIRVAADPGLPCRIRVAARPVLLAANLLRDRPPPHRGSSLV